MFSVLSPIQHQLQQCLETPKTWHKINIALCYRWYFFFPIKILGIYRLATMHFKLRNEIQLTVINIK